MDLIQESELAEFGRKAGGIASNVNSIIYGQEREVKTILAALLSGGHILLEDMPGTGKTTLALLLAKSIAAAPGRSHFKRIQFTPDLLPMDITGSNVYDQRKGEFMFHPGPVFSPIVLADELNRASPKVQSALLQCMAEGEVTVENATYPLGKPFFVIATQNPLETEGTYPLAIAQLDRFYAKISLSGISWETNRRILADYLRITAFEGVEQIATLEEISGFQRLADRVFASDALVDLIVDIVHETRCRKELIQSGASPRASIIYLKLAKAWALLSGRAHVTEEDVKELAGPCLRHRLRFGYDDPSGAALAEIVDACVHGHSRRG